MVLRFTDDLVERLLTLLVHEVICRFFRGVEIGGCVDAVLAPRLAILDPKIKLIFVFLRGKLPHLVQLLLPDLLIFFRSFRGWDSDIIYRLVNLHWNNHCSYTVSDEHLLLGDPLFNEIDDFARLAICCRLLHVQILQSIVHCFYLNLVQLGYNLFPKL